MFGTGLGKVLGFFVSAGHVKVLTTLLCSAAVSRKGGRFWGGNEGKRFRGGGVRVLFMLC